MDTSACLSKLKLWAVHADTPPRTQPRQWLPFAHGSTSRSFKLAHQHRHTSLKLSFVGFPTESLYSRMQAHLAPLGISSWGSTLTCRVPHLGVMCHRPNYRYHSACAAGQLFFTAALCVCLRFQCTTSGRQSCNASNEGFDHCGVDLVTVRAVLKGTDLNVVNAVAQVRCEILPTFGE